MTEGSSIHIPRFILKVSQFPECFLWAPLHPHTPLPRCTCEKNPIDVEKCSICGARLQVMIKMEKKGVLMKTCNENDEILYNFSLLIKNTFVSQSFQFGF